jgi:hypothetical protein
LIVVSDGVYTDTINVARQAVKAEGDQISAAAREWVPIRATSLLDQNSVASQLAGLSSSNGAFAYDTKKIRLFRWYPYNGNAGKDEKWIEYSTTPDSLFNFVPGRVIWMKVTDNTLVKFGKGVTLPLKAPAVIELAPKCYTDISNPFNFDIYLRDILSSSGPAAENLVFYRWTRGVKGYVTQSLYTPGGPGSNDVRLSAKIISLPQEDAYTVYNPTDAPIVLRIPPVPQDLSIAPPPVSAKKATTDDWCAVLQWKHSRNDKATSLLFCGYSARAREAARYPLPPSFARSGVGICDQNRLFGYAVMSRLDRNGIAYQLKFFNDGDEAAEIWYHTDSTLAGRSDMQVSLYDPASGTVTPVDGWQSIKLAKGSSEYRWLVVGGADYQSRFRQGFTRYPLGLARLSPNPCRSSLRIQYTVPYNDVSELTFAIFSLSGRKVWEHRIDRQIISGEGQLVWNSAADPRQQIAAGMYLLRMTARFRDQSAPKSIERRFVFVK